MPELVNPELIIPLLTACLLDAAFGDPAGLPHPVVGFGRMISWAERRLNRGRHRKAKGALMTLLLDAAVFFAAWGLLRMIGDSPLAYLNYPLSAILIFYCLAGKTLIKEVRQVFLALERSLEDGRRQVARIVGRDTSELTAQEVRTAALETLAENLSDGVIAPLFWLAIGGVPAMLTYKMVNTQDSMIGYRTPRYKDFGCWAARIDDMANYIPARLTALLMILPYVFLRGDFSLPGFVWRNGRRHASPNSGYPEAALAGILRCRFGGPHYYFGQLFYKPYIGENDRPLSVGDMRRAVRVNRITEFLAVLILLIIYSL
ncbi:MAG: adenosylcobinamide-phosphate synthase CbiB [Bacteroidaceae bacterium]|nr:adenosylcobinamide-phosphate synthase CbiB [Bacteroidaceae bacterium]